MKMFLLLVLATVAVVLVAEFFVRWAFFKEFPPRRWWRNRVQRRQPHVLPERDINIPANDTQTAVVEVHKASAVAEDMHMVRPIVRTIAELLLKDFITCSIHGDLSVLGDGSEQELRQAYNHLLSQYYEARNDEHMKSYIKLVRDIRYIELRGALVETLVRMMTHRYSREGAKALKTMYPAYAFTQESYATDIDMVMRAEVQHERRYDRLVKQLKAHEDTNKSMVAQTPEQRHRSMIANLMDINKLEGVKYDVHTMTVLEYAVAESRKTEYIESLKNQLHG